MVFAADSAVDEPSANLAEGSDQHLEPSPSQMSALQQAVLARFPMAMWVIDGEFGRIQSGDVLVSLRFPLRDPDCERMAWLDASQRLGTGNEWSARQGRLIDPN